MTAIPLVRRKIETQITLGADEFGGGGNQKTYLNLATSLRIQRDGLIARTAMQLDIHNIRIEDAELMTTIGMRIGEIKRNYVTVKAGDENRRDVVFRGEIFEAFPTIDGVDRYAFHIRAMEGIYDKMTAEEVRTVQGDVSALTLLKEYAEKIGCVLVNNGIPDVVLTDIALTGSPVEKMMQIGRAMGNDIEVFTEHSLSGIVYVKRIGEPISSIPVAVISKETGLINYPCPTPYGVMFTHLFSPIFRNGGLVEIRDSRIKKAVGRFTAWRVGTFLQCDGAGRNWVSAVEANSFNPSKKGE